MLSQDICLSDVSVNIAIFPVRAERYICAVLALCKHDQIHRQSTQVSVTATKYPVHKPGNAVNH